MSNKEHKEILKVTEPKQYNLLDVVSEVSEESLPFRDNCKLCNCEFRAEAEALWERTKYNTSAVLRFLESKNVSISDRAISNHMKYHYSSLQRKIAVKNYASNLKKFLEVKNDRINEIAVLRAVLFKELLDIGAESDSLSLQERRKNAEILSKLSSQIIACNDSERRITEDWRPVNIFVEKLTDIISIEQKNASPEAKEKLTNIVNALYREVEGITLEKK